MKRTAFLVLILAFCWAAGSICLVAQSGSVATSATTAATKPAAAQTPFYFTRPITHADLYGRKLRELSLMRNTIYARAGNKFRKKWLNEYFSQFAWYHPQATMDLSKISALDRKNAMTIEEYDAGLGSDYLWAARNWLKKLPSLTPEQKIELRLLSERLGEFSGDPEDRTPLSDPTMLDAQLNMDQLSDLSRRDLRLLRNMIYARRGRPFTSELLGGYFASMKWYKPDPAYTDARLTALDHRNINIIRSLEDELGGPLSDYEHKKEDGWFAAA